MGWLKALLPFLSRLLEIIHQKSIERKTKDLGEDIERVSENVADAMAGDSGRVQHSTKTLDDLRSGSPSSESSRAG